MRSSGLVLFVCSGLLLSGGAILGGSTAWSLLRLSFFFWTTDLGVELGSTVLFVAGALLCLPTCWLASLVPYHPRSLSLLATLMFLVTAGMLLLSTGMSSITGLSRALREPESVNASMLRAMQRERFDPATRSAFSSMQLEFKCCGVQAYNDWYHHRSNLPPSCCDRVTNLKHSEACTTPMHTGGCLRPALLELRYFVNCVSILASAIIVVLAGTLFAAAYSLVVNVVERADLKPQPQPQPQPLRIECLGARAHAPPPLVTLTSPVPVPIPARI